MLRIAAGAALAAVLGALSGAATLFLVYRHTPGIAITLDRPPTGILSGVYGVERSGDLAFSWTGPKAAVTLPGIDRGVPWRCVIRLRGGRAPGVPQPDVAVDVDGVPAARVAATNIFEDLAVDVPPRDGDGLTLHILSAPTFVPGPGDTRELGVQLDHVACDPVASPRPPRHALAVAAAASAVFAVGIVLIGAPLGMAIAATVAISAIQALAVTTGFALYVRYLDRVPWLAIFVMLPSIVFGLAATRAGAAPAPHIRFVLAYLPAALYLVLLALLHPSKALVDALFHAHRLEWVHAGRYFFTQPMPSGVSFPYAIALYVVASPWMALTRDYVTLLRVVVCAVHAIAALLLYVVVARVWQDRLAAAAAAVFYTLVPQWFMVVGNANLTGAFAQSMATITLLAAAGLTLGSRDAARGVVLFVLAAIAFLSHVGTFPLLCVTLVFSAALVWWRGDRTDRPAARWVALATVAAAVFSVAIYYGHFTEVYRSLDRVTGRSTAVDQASPAIAEPKTVQAPTAAIQVASTPSFPSRVVTAAMVGVRATGWPLMVLAAAGLWHLVRRRSNDRLTLMLVAWGAACLVFLASGVITPVEPRFYRYTVEYLGRVIYATWPALVILSGLGAASAWKAAPLGRAIAIALVIGAIALAANSWLGWIGRG